LILVRHGETLWNRERRMQGQMDIPLSDIGQAQARAVGTRLAMENFAALYSSDLSRAYATAQAIAGACGKAIVSDRALRERTFGIFEGLTGAEIAERYPKDNERFVAREPDFEMRGGESSRAFYTRVLECLGRIARAHPGERVVVVTHGLVLDSVYRAARGMDLIVRREAPLYNASLNIYGYTDSGWTELVWGDVEHLAEVGVTHYGGRVA
jgi:probable phosphoglycerate mutase